MRGHPIWANDHVHERLRFNKSLSQNSVTKAKRKREGRKREEREEKTSAGATGMYHTGKLQRSSQKLLFHTMRKSFESHN